MGCEHVHLIGIGGTGMTALAGLLHHSGCRVTGSDAALYPPTSTLLEQLGLPVRSSFEASNLQPAPDLVVVGNAVSRGNPEVEELLDRGLRYTSMPRLIAERFLQGHHSIVVAGTHGKTTTASMLAWTLANAGRDPGFLIGGLPLNFDFPFHVGSGGAFVLEGDEYDTAFFDKGPKFMHYRPDTALLGTVEFDHVDIYRDVDQIRTVFERLVQLVPRRGLLVRHEESPLAVEASASAHCRVEGYGFEEGRWRASGCKQNGEVTRFRLLRDQQPFAELRLGLLGRHNVRNAMAVAAAATEQGLSAEEIARGLATFRGVRRRLELRGKADGVTVLDDFAHHPTAIAETVRAVAHRFAAGKVWAVLEPRSWSLRRNVFQDRLVGSFQGAHEVVIAPVYRAEAIPADQRLDVERLVADLNARGSTAHGLPDIESIVAFLAASCAPGDVVVIMSNGGFEGLHERLLTVLRHRTSVSETS